MDSTLNYLTTKTTYDLSAFKFYAFRRGTDEVDGMSLALGNMVSGFPFAVEGVTFQNSECAYIAGMFSDGSDLHLKVQEALQIESNGFMAKKRIRRYNEDSKRDDWEEYNVMWMLYVVWCKCIGNETFWSLLLSLPADAVIIEDSTFQRGATATFWGARNDALRTLHKGLDRVLKAEGVKKSRRKAMLDSHRLGQWRNVGKFVGCNCMGKILMLCRDALVLDTVPPIDLELLRAKRINLLGEILKFESIPTAISLKERA